MQQACQYPIHQCWVGADWGGSGLTTIIMARSLPNKQFLIGVYLIDLYCLGVKNAFWQVIHSPRALQKTIEKASVSHEGGMITCEPEFAHQMIYGALEYAQKYGFKPHPDFKMAQAILEPSETYTRTFEISFGKNGKPLYVAGPYDSPMKIRNIINTLKETAGDGNFDTLITIG